MRITRPIADHPQIQQTIRTGYPTDDTLLEIEGTDFYNKALYTGDDVVEHDGETIHADNWEQYCSTEIGASFRRL